MTPLIPFAISAIGAVLSEMYGENKGESFGALPNTGPLRRKIGPTIASKIAPTRFSKGSAMTDISEAKKRRGGSRKNQSSNDSESSSSPEEETKEESIDPREVVRRQIEEELLIDALANEVVDDMDLGYDPDLEESLPTDDEFLEKYEPLNSEPDDEEFGYIKQRNIFAPGSGWGIRRQR